MALREPLEPEAEGAGGGRVAFDAKRGEIAAQGIAHAGLIPRCRWVFHGGSEPHRFSPRIKDLRGFDEPRVAPCLGGRR